jgi:hypothetical protein
MRGSKCKSTGVITLHVLALNIVLCCTCVVPVAFEMLLRINEGLPRSKPKGVVLI